MGIRHSLRRRPLRGVVLAGVVVACLIGSGGALATKTASDSYHRVPVGNTPFDLGTQVCGFPIHVGIVSDKEYYTHQTTLADGTLIQQINGNLVLSFTNTINGKMIVENLSGPGTFTSYPDGSFLTNVQGLNSSFFGPIGQANTGEPGFVLSAGHLVIHYSATTGAADSFTLSGTQTNGCQLLS
jgi:hypothetical protein